MKNKIICTLLLLTLLLLTACKNQESKQAEKVNTTAPETTIEQTTIPYVSNGLSTIFETKLLENQFIINQFFLTCPEHSDEITEIDGAKYSKVTDKEIYTKELFYSRFSCAYTVKTIDKLANGKMYKIVNDDVYVNLEAAKVLTDIQFETDFESIEYLVKDDSVCEASVSLKFSDSTSKTYTADFEKEYGEWKLTNLIGA